MSRAALELERQVKAMRAEAAKSKPKKQEQNVANGDNEGNELTGTTGPGMTDLSEVGEEYTGNDAGASKTGTTEERAQTVSKKKASGSKKSAKGSKKAAAPAAGGAKAERKSRVKVVSGDLQSVEAKGSTYLQLNFTEGHIVLTPTGNREANRDLAVKALRAALK